MSDVHNRGPARRATLLLHAAALGAALLLPARAAAQLPTTVDALVDGVASTAHLPGKKDLAANFDVFRLGWALWDTNELGAGYDGAVAELIKQATTPGLAPSQHYLDVAAQVACSLPYLTPTGAIHPQLQAFFDAVLDSPFSRFDMPADLQPALGTAGINLLCTQSTVFSPVRNPAGGVSFWNYPGLAAIVAQFPPPATWPGMRLIQDIGFANNPGFPIGDYDYGFEHPLVTKPGTPEFVNGSDALSVYVRSDVVDDITAGGAVLDPGTVTKLFYCLPLSMLHPEVAGLLRQSIQQRVQQYADGHVSSFSIGGEFAFAAPIKPAPPDGCAPVDGGCNPVGGESAAASYYCHLPDSDYSTYSLYHFRSWLQDRYGSIPALEAAWNANLPAACGSIAGCLQVSPLQAVLYPPLGGGTVNWSAILDDWIAFQAGQLSAARVFQYVAAKQARPDRAMELYEGDPRGADEAAQLSDGVSLGTFLPPSIPLGELPSRVKKIALHGAAYGEAVDFPLFGMKQDVAAGVSGPPHDWPSTWLPATFHENHSRRMLDEFLTLGVNAVGLAYFESINHWNVKDGIFTHDCPALPGTQDLNMAACLGAEVAAQQDRLAFMTPWRSPLLLDTGSWATLLPGIDLNAYESLPPLSSLLNVLADEQVQYAPFADLAGLQDLWLPATRQVLMVPFLPELDAALLQTLRSFAAARGLHLVLLLDAASEAALPLPTCFALGSPATDYHVVFLPVAGQAACLSPLVHAAIVYHGTAADASYAMLKAAVQLTDLLVTRPLRPVRAESSPGVLAHGVDVSVATDGLSLLVCATNTRPVPQSFTLVPAVPGFSGTIPDGASPAAPLLQSQALLRYVKADVPPNAIQLLAHALDVAVTKATAQVGNLGSVAPTFDTLAAQQLLQRLRSLSSQSAPEKVLAGLVRLRRMPFVRAEPASGNQLKVSAVTIDRKPIEGAAVQLEFVLQQHARRNGITAHANFPNDPAAGTVTLPAAKPADTIWDFTLPGKTIPAGNLIEVQVQHPQYYSQGRTLLQL